MSKCACGNEQGKPLVSPMPHKFIDSVTKKEVDLRYNAGMMPLPDGGAICWFCAHPCSAPCCNPNHPANRVEEQQAIPA